MRAIPLAILFLACRAAAADGPALMRAVRTATAAHSSLRCTFTLHRHLAVFDEPVRSTGSLEIDRDAGGVRWEFDGELLLILHDGRLRRWNADGEEEPVDPRRDPGTAALKRQMRALLTGAWDAVHAGFAVSAGADPERDLVLRPTDPELGRFIDEIAVHFDPATGFPRRLVIEAVGDNRTVYRFAEPELDAGIEPARFAGPDG